MGSIEDFFKDPLSYSLDPRPKPVRPSGLKGKIGVGIHGATLGLKGYPPETLGESLIEMGGSLAPIAGISAIAGPVVGGAARAAGLELGPVASKIIASGVTGAVAGGIEDPSLTGIAKGAGVFAGAETGLIGAGKVLSKIRGRAPSVISEIKPEIETEVAKPETETPELSQAGALKAEVETISKTVPDLPVQPELQFPAEQQSFKFLAPQYGPEISGRRTPISDTLRARQLLENEESKTVEQIAADRKTAASLLRGSSRDRITLRDIAVDSKGNRLSLAPKDVAIHFQVETDPETGLQIYKPLTPEADKAIMELFSNETGRQLELPLRPEQLNFLNTIGRGIKRTLDIVTRQDNFSTTNVAKMSEEAANAVVASMEIPIADFVKIVRSPAQDIIDSIVKRNNIDPKIISEVVRDVDRMLGISGLSGDQMQVQIDLIEQAANALGLEGAQKTAFIHREMISRGLKAEYKLKAGPKRDDLRRQMIHNELIKRCGVTTPQIMMP